jgi:hypothetical protein
MYREACSRIEDGLWLDRQWPASESNSGYLLRVLGFEVLLKAALKLFGVPYPTGQGGHRYVGLWGRLPPDARQEVISVATDRMAGVSKQPDETGGDEDYYQVADLSHGKDLDRVLNHAEQFFTRARYQYEYFEGFTDEEQQAVETRWLERGAPQDEADVVTYAPEVDALIAGLRALIEPRLSSPAAAV